MASGHWSETNKPIRPGFYNRFKAAALARIQMGKRGIVAMPVKANWGPVKTIQRITSENSLIEQYGSDMNYTAFKLGRLALLGQPKELLLYRLTDGTEKVASLSLQAEIETVAKEVIKLETKYPTTRDFKVTVKPNVAEPLTQDIVLYEGAKSLHEFKGISGTLAELVSVINSDTENKWITATNLDTANSNAVTLNSISTVAFTGGSDGAAGVTSENYIEAMTAFEGRKLNGFSLDGVTDPAIHTSVKAWVERNRKAGKKIRAYIGGTSKETVAEANNRSKSLNYEGTHNVIVPGILDGVEYTPAETACYVMALGEGQDAKECLCNEATVFQDVGKHLTHEEIKDALLSGSLVLRYDDGVVVIEDDKNTLTRYGQDQNETWGYLRAIKFMDMVDEDTSATGNKQYVGKILNGTTGKLALLSALKLYFETLQTAGLIEEFEIGIDEELDATALNDEFYWKWSAKYINVMKKIFSTGHIK